MANDGLLPGEAEVWSVPAQRISVEPPSPFSYSRRRMDPSGRLVATRERVFFRTNWPSRIFRDADASWDFDDIADVAIENVRLRERPSCAAWPRLILVSRNGRRLGFSTTDDRQSRDQLRVMLDEHRRGLHPPLA